MGASEGRGRAPMASCHMASGPAQSSAAGLAATLDATKAFEGLRLAQI